VADFRGFSVVILLDFDEEGEEMTRRLGRELEDRGLKIGHSNRRRLAQILTREGIYRVEELTSIIEKASL